MSFTVQKIIFKSNHYQLAGNLFLLRNQQKLGVLFIHGGGTSNKERYQEIQTFHAKNDISSFSFDSQGVGESEGIFKESSLISRLQNAQDAFDIFSKHVKEIVVCGTSMGAHVAVKLSKTRKTRALILLYGAAYGLNAEDKPFTQELTNVLRQKNSWRSSPIFPILKSYTNPVFIAYGQKDKVIPKEVQAEFKKSVKESDVFVELPNASHLMLTPINTDEKIEKQKLFSLLLDFIARG